MAKSKPITQVPPKEKEPQAQIQPKEKKPEKKNESQEKPIQKVEAQKPGKEIEDQTHENPYGELVSKRLRTLRKRLIKIEKNEEMKAQGQTLNEDQKISISQKKEVLSGIHELEEVLKGIAGVELELAKEEKKQQKRRQQEEQHRLQIQHEKHQDQVRKTLQLFYTLNQFESEDVRSTFSTGKVDGYSLTETQTEQLLNSRNSILLPYDTSSGINVIGKEFYVRVSKLSNEDKEEVVAGLTYKQLHDLLLEISSSSYFDPEEAKRLAKERAEAEALALKKQEELQGNYELIDYADVPPASLISPEQVNGDPTPIVSFMSESEVLGDGPPNVLSFHPQAGETPTVIVPLPQGFFEARNPIMMPPYMMNQNQPFQYFQPQFQPHFQQQQEQHVQQQLQQLHRMHQMMHFQHFQSQQQQLHQLSPQQQPQQTQQQSSPQQQTQQSPTQQHPVSNTNGISVQSTENGTSGENQSEISTQSGSHQQVKQQHAPRGRRKDNYSNPRNSHERSDHQQHHQNRFQPSNPRYQKDPRPRGYRNDARSGTQPAPASN